MKSPILTYDAEAKALYLRLTDHEVAETHELSRLTYLDVDAKGVPVGVEILNADPDLFADVASRPEGAPLSDALKHSAA